MEIVDRQRFLTMSPGTVYSLYETVCFNGLYIKEDTIEGTRDFQFRNILTEVRGTPANQVREMVKRAVETREKYELYMDAVHIDDVEHEDTLYAIWDDVAIDSLAKVLTNPQRTEYWLIQSRVSYGPTDGRMSTNTSDVQVDAFMRPLSGDLVSADAVQLTQFIARQLKVLIDLIKDYPDAVLHFDMGRNLPFQRGYLTGALEMGIALLNTPHLSLEVDPLFTCVRATPH